MNRKRYTILCALVLLALASIAYADTTQRVGAGYLIDAYALKNGGMLTAVIDNRAERHYLVFSFDDLSGEVVQREWPMPSHYDKRGRPRAITEVCGGVLHAWLAWDEDDTFLHYSWRLPMDVHRRYFPLVCRNK